MSEALILLTMDDVSERLHVSRRKLQDIVKAHPFYRKAGRQKLFTESDFNALVQALPCPSKSFHIAEAKISTSAAPSAGKVSSRLRELQMPKRRKQSGSSVSPNS